MNGIGTEVSMQTIEGFDFVAISFDKNGALESPQELESLIARAKSLPATDAIFIAHGFRNDASEATRLYTNFLKTFRAHLSRPEFQKVAARRFVVAGVFWPSKAFRETFDDEPGSTRALRDPAFELNHAKTQLDELKRDVGSSERAALNKAERLLPVLEGNPRAQDEFVELVLSLFKHSVLDETEGLPQIRKHRGAELLARLDAPTDAGTRGLGDALGPIAGRVGQFLNVMTWYLMKERSGAVGAAGVAAAVRAVEAGRPGIRIHLVGHSLGGRLMAACAKTLCDAPRLQPDSLMLLEAAFSHYGFSSDNGRGSAGFFRRVIDDGIVKGPLVATFSAEDTVVGKAYAIASRLAGDNTRAIGDASDEFGGIGRNGPQKTPEATTAKLLTPGTVYDYRPGVVSSLDGSGGLIKSHGDVTNPAVTYAFACALART